VGGLVVLGPAGRDHDVSTQSKCFRDWDIENRAMAKEGRLLAFGVATSCPARGILLPFIPFSASLFLLSIPRRLAYLHGFAFSCFHGFHCRCEPRLMGRGCRYQKAVR